LFAPGSQNQLRNECASGTKVPKTETQGRGREKSTLNLADGGRHWLLPRHVTEYVTAAGFFRLG
jgi:hypothetical protein